VVDKVAAEGGLCGRRGEGRARDAADWDRAIYKELAAFVVDELLGGVSNSSSTDRDPGEHRDTQAVLAGTTGTIRPPPTRPSLHTCSHYSHP
jgi:hypothetical protein